MTDTPLIAVHSVPGSWLPRTQKWLHDQVRFLPPFVQSHVVCDRVEHRESFAGPAIHAAGSILGTPRWRRSRSVTCWVNPTRYRPTPKHSSPI